MRAMADRCEDAPACGHPECGFGPDLPAEVTKALVDAVIDADVEGYLPSVALCQAIVGGVLTALRSEGYLVVKEAELNEAHHVLSYADGDDEAAQRAWAVLSYLLDPARRAKDEADVQF